MTDNGLPCLDLLEATPAILRGLMSEVTDNDARWKPGPDRFSIAPKCSLTSLTPKATAIARAWIFS